MEDFNNNERDREEIFSKKIRAGKRTYFFDVKATRGNDYYITITESKKRQDNGMYIKHKIFLYKEDFNKFMDALNETVDHVKSELMPEYDFEEFNRPQENYSNNSNTSSDTGAGSSENTETSF